MAKLKLRIPADLVVDLDLDDDEPAAASVRWGLAKGIVGRIDEWLVEYERRKKEGKE